MIKLKLKFWENGPILTILKNAAQDFFNYYYSLVDFSLQSLDLENCPLAILNLVAWARLIERFPEENERQYRLRVIYAVENSKDAGSAAGLAAIFARLELGAVVVNERVPGLDWDIIQLEIIGNQSLLNNTNYINWLLTTFGKTCRRYQFTDNTPINLYILPANFSCDYHSFYCSE